MNEPLLVAPGGRWHFEAAADTRRNVKALKRVLVARVALYCDRAEDCCCMPGFCDPRMGPLRKE